MKIFNEKENRIMKSNITVNIQKLITYTILIIIKHWDGFQFFKHAFELRFENLK